MQIKPYDKTIGEILTNTIYVIPNFQREFSWDKKYYKEFFYDMLNQIQMKEELISSDYFLGTMLFLKDSETAQLKVIDGQQRLTTITILFSAISRILKENSEDILAEATFKYIVFKDRRGVDRKVIYPPSSFPYFTKVIQKPKPDVSAFASSDEEDLIKETYDYFKKALSEKEISKTLKDAFKNRASEEILDINKYGYINTLVAIRDQVLDTKIIYIESESHEHANMIFEILNAKGKKLTAIDLIKNKIFENIGDTLDEESEIQWKKIQGILQKNDISILVFFMHYWASVHKKCTANSLYNNVNSYISKGNKEERKTRTTTLLNDLIKNAEIYSYICDPDRISFWNGQKAYQEVIDSLIFTKGFNISQYRIPVLALIKAKKENKITMKWFLKSLKCIEEFSFVFFKLFSSRASKVETLFSNFAIELTNCEKSEAVSVIEKNLLNGLKNIIQNYEEFKVRFIDLYYTNSLDKDDTDYLLVRYIINKINMHYSCNSKIMDKSCSIEHILPDDPNNKTTWNIGNLMPLEELINNRLGDLGYSDKKTDYLTSSYPEVKKFVDDNELWCLDQIEDRAIVIANTFYNEIMNAEIRKK